MAQHDYVIDNSTGANVRADINSVLQAIASNNSGSSAPSTTFATQFFADTSAGIMKLRNTSNNGYVNLFTLAGGIDVDAVSNFNEDVTFTGASNNIVFDKSEDALKFADNAIAKFGASNDLQIHHDGSVTSFIAATTANLRISIAGGSNTLQLNKGLSPFEQMAQFTGDGAAELFFNGSRKFQTTANGADFTVASGGQVNIFGSGGDNGLRISGPQSASSACLFFNTNHQNVSGGTDQYTIQCGGANHTLLFKHGDTTGNTVFELDDTEHVRIPQDSKALKIGAGQDLQLVHDGTDSVISNATGDFEMRGAGAGVGNVLLRPKTGENGVIVKPDDAVELYHDNSKKLETNANGIKVSGSAVSPEIGIFHATSGSYTSATLQSVCSRNTSNESYSHFKCSVFGIGDRMFVRDNGDVENTNGTVASISDVNLKENIVDASSQWDDIKNIRVRNFNFKEGVDPQKPTLIGVIAQEAELVCPNLVKTSKSMQAGEEKDYKVFKYSILHMKAIKALQEAMAKIETLETKVAALEAA